MRRKDREVTELSKIVEIIEECDIVRIGLSDGDYPYIVPLNFAYSFDSNKIALFIHGAMSGRKFEMLNNNPKCSFEMDIPLRMECLVDKKDVTMRYKCVMGKATAVLLEGDEKQAAIDNIIMARYAQTRNFVYNRSAIVYTAVFRLDVEEVTCKVNPLSEEKRSVETVVI